MILVKQYRKAVKRLHTDSAGRSWARRKNADPQAAFSRVKKRQAGTAEFDAMISTTAIGFAMKSQLSAPVDKDGLRMKRGTLKSVVGGGASVAKRVTSVMQNHHLALQYCNEIENK